MVQISPKSVLHPILAAIDNALASDQGSRFYTIQDEVQKVFNASESPHISKGRIGISHLGHDCPRLVWYDFRRASIEHHKARTLRIFNRGSREEVVMISLLKLVCGSVFYTAPEGKQIGVGTEKNKHIGGFLDAVSYDVPGYPAGELVVCEFKTASKKSFGVIQRGKNLEKTNKLHYAQIVGYMYATGAQNSLYLCVCKDDDCLHAESVPPNREHAEYLIDRGIKIIKQPTPPKRISEDPTWYTCKWCRHHRYCHSDEKTINRSCRTCKRSEARDDGTWYCRLHKHTLDWQQQINNCAKYDSIT